MKTGSKLLLIVVVMLGAMCVAQYADEDCARRTCPAGTKPQIVRYHGCVCIGQPR